jgi:hypothetical protein
LFILNKGERSFETTTTTTKIEERIIYNVNTDFKSDILIEIKKEKKKKIFNFILIKNIN